MEPQIRERKPSFVQADFASAAAARSETLRRARRFDAMRHAPGA
jgi:hypothetical protein